MTQRPAISFPVIVFAVLLCGAAFVAYSPALSGKFVWDDASWTSEVGDLLHDSAGLRKMWSDPTALQQYYPVTGTTFWLDRQWWGDWTTPYHIENLLLHITAALLFWRLLWRLGVPGAWLAAGIFMLHPTMVESAAWIAERKNVLSMVLYLAALLAYGKFMGFWREEEHPRRWGSYGLAFIFFALALLAKVSVFALPAVVLLITWWKTGRVRWKRDVLPALPLFVAAITFGFFIAWLEKYKAGAEGEDWDLTLPERILVAGRALSFYAGQLVWPYPQCPVYPRWQLETHSFVQWLWPAGVLLAFAAAWFLRDRVGRGLLVALLYFAGCLFPLLGFMNAYGTIFSFVAHRWAYVSSLGLIALGAAFLSSGALGRSRWMTGIKISLLLLLAAGSWRTAGAYRGPNEFWKATLAVNPDCWVAYYDMGNDRFAESKFDEAISLYSRAIALRPGYVPACNNLGGALFRIGRLDDAAQQFEKVIQITPENPRVYFNLANCLFSSGRLAEAVAQYQKCLDLAPQLVEVHNSLALALFRQGNAAEGLVQYREVARLKPEDAASFRNLAEALRMSGAVHEAAARYEEALRLDPDDLTSLGRLAWVRATAQNSVLRNGEQALRMAQHAEEISHGKNLMVLHSLAAAYAENGQFPQAMETARRALMLTSAGDPFYEVLKPELQRYELGLPIRE